MIERNRNLFDRLSALVQDPDVWGDVLSSLILVLMILTIWLMGWRGYRPAKHLFEWIRRYPMLAAFYGLFTLMSWGVVGTQYGVRTLLIADDGLVQFLCGFALIAIFLRLSFQYVILDRSRERWFWTLDTCLDVEHAIFGGDMRVRIAGNGKGPGAEAGGEAAQDHGTMKVSDLKRLLRRDVAEQPEASKVLDILDSDRFRISMAPLILDFYSSILIVFLGLIPLILGFQPLLGEVGAAVSSGRLLALGGSAVTILMQRGSWLFGVLAGVLLAKSLVRNSTERFQKYVSDMIARGQGDSGKPDKRLIELREEWPERTLMEGTLTGALEKARARDRARQDAARADWRKLPFLSSAIVMSMLILASVAESSNRQRDAGDTANFPTSMLWALTDISKDLSIALISLFLLGITFAIVGILAVGFVDFVRGAFAFFMGRTIFAFRTNLAVIIGLVTFGVAAVLAALGYFLQGRFESLIYPFMAVAGSILIQWISTIQRGPVPGRKSVLSLTGYWVAIVVLVPVFTTSWSRTLQAQGVWASYALGLAKYLFALKAGSWMVRWTTTIFDPLISYPVSAIWGFMAFSGFFVELPEPSQAQVPAAFTVIYFAGVLASAITCVLHSASLSDPKRIVLAAIVTVLIIGQGWSTSPNRFKLRFPGLDGESMLPVRPGLKPSTVVNYYDKPVRLNSEAYFRITNRFVVKLHLQDVTKKNNEKLSIRASNRLASGMIPPTLPKVAGTNEFPEANGLKIGADGTIRFRFFDEQNVDGNIRTGSDYLRLRPGDPLELIRLDTRFGFRSNAAEKTLEIGLKASGLELDFPEENTTEKIYSVAESLTLKLTDSQELDSGIRAALRRSGGERWKADIDGQQYDATVRFADGKVLISGPFVERIQKKIGEFENSATMAENAIVPVRMQPIDSAIVTATWPAAVAEVRTRPLPGKFRENGKPVERTEIDVVWPFGTQEKLRGILDEEANSIASFLHLAYLVAVTEGTDQERQRARMQELLVRQDSERPPRNAWNAIWNNLRLDGFGPGLVRPGDCLSFEFFGWESPMKIVDQVHVDPDEEIHDLWKPVLKPFLLSDRSLWDAILVSPSAFIKGFENDPATGMQEPGVDPAQAAEGRIAEQFVRAISGVENQPPADDSGTIDSRNLFVLRQGTYGGVFAFDPAFEKADREKAGLRTVFIYGAHRVREQDRIVLQWLDAESGNLRKSATFEVVDTASEMTVGGVLPPAGYQAMSLRPIDTRGTENSDAGGRVFAFQDELPDGGGNRLAGTWARLEMLDNYDVLTAWKEANPRADGKKPKLVIVTVSGGGIRSEVWTATVLEALTRNLGHGFSRSIRIITGASGGMVAASDFVGNIYREGLQWRPGHSPIAYPADSLSESRVKGGYLARNQLDSVIGQMIYSDIPSALNPLPRKSDRGRTLEKSWARIAREKGNDTPSPFERSIRELAAGEAAGWRPSIVFTPMMVEDGRRLLISNLDLSFVTRNVSALLMEETRRKIKHAAYENNSTERLINRADDLLSLSSVEFFRIFPDAWQFSVGTATRMSASFPWVAPAVSIPTIPPRRIVDAGYYDNFGVNLASLWLSEMRDWLRQNTGGVLLVQIRDHESQSRRTDIDFDVETGKDASSVREKFDKITNGVFDRNVTHVLHPILTPLSGAATARSWTMSFRNDEQVELLDELFNARETEENAFFRTVVFECPVEASLSWNLSEEEVVNITSGFGMKDPGLIDPGTGADRKGDSDERGEAGKIENERKRRMLEAIGIDRKRLAALRDSQVKELHDNIFGNRKRVQLLKNWWNR